ncbi:MAG: DNA repair protein RecN [Ruminococcaceae bacterium]|nr:DNA repair protein RecN [Oscillospiraceae bacterium]
MLRHIHIENVAVVKAADIDFHYGFSVLTGETGAGKSVIIDSVKLLTGKRVSRDLIRTGEDYAYCEALFDGICPEHEAYLNELGVETDDGEVLVCVKLGADGKTLSKINGKTVTKTTLREVGQRLISIHGQKDSDMLTDEKNYVGLLDSYADTDALKREYFEIYSEIKLLQKSLDSLIKDETEIALEKDMLSYRIKDIDALKLKVGEEEALCDELKRLESAERINKHTALTYKILHGADNGGVSGLLSRAANSLSQISGVSADASELSERLNDISYEISDIAHRVKDIAVDTDGDPTERLDKIQDRLEKISKLKKKYGDSIEKVLEFRNNAEARLEELEVSDEKCDEYRLKISQKRAEAQKIAQKLTTLRKKAAKEVSERVEQTLEYLDMPSVKFQICVTPAEDLNSTGADVVSFFVATNPGEPPKPMVEIASGGELSRIMLSLRSVLNQKDNVGCSIYDEIDTGISGKTSRKIGIKLREAACGGQVICVTHSAQIATLADTHLLISKLEKDGRSFTTVCELDGEQRVDEAARILGGINVTEAQKQAARDMIEEKNNF